MTTPKPVTQWTNREMLEVQFRKAIRRGFVRNAVMITKYFPPKKLRDEVVIIEVINRQSIGIPFTETGLFAPNYGFLPYTQIADVHWISRDFEDACRKKSTHWDQLELKLQNGHYLVLEALDGASDPVRKFFEWIVARNARQIDATDPSRSVAQAHLP